MALNQPTTLGAASGAANLQSLLFVLLSQLQNIHNNTMARYQAELLEEREKYFQRMNRLADRERDLSLEMSNRKLEVLNLLEQNAEYQQRLEKTLRDLEDKKNTISRLEDEKMRLGSQLENPVQIQSIIEDIKDNLTTSVLKQLEQQQQQLSRKRREQLEQQQPSAPKKSTGYFENETLNHYVWQRPETCGDELIVLDTYLRRLPSLLIGKTAEVALLEATKLNQIPEMEILLATGVPVDKLTADSRTLLWWAAYNGHVAACQVLLSRGARTNAISPGWISSTALHVAAWMGHLKVVQLLVENGGDIETKSSESQTTIFYATRRGQVNIVQYLVEVGADLEARDLNGKTAIESATAPVAQWFKHWLSKKNESNK